MVLVWVDFLEMPIQFYPWINEIGSQVGVVKGHKLISAVNPKWEPQLLIDIDLSTPLKEEVLLLHSFG